MHINHGSMGHRYWPMTHLTHPDLLTHLAHDPLTRYVLLLCDRLLWQQNSGRPSQKSRTRTQTPQISHKNWGKIINKEINFMKIRKIFVPLFSQDTPMEWTPLRVRWFSFFISQVNLKPTRSVIHLHGCMLVALKKLRNTALPACLVTDEIWLVSL